MVCVNEGYERWKQDWLNISKRKEIYNNEISYNGKAYYPDILSANTIVEFVSTKIRIKEMEEKTMIYKLLGYRVIWVVYLYDEYINRKVVKVREDEEEVLYEYIQKNYNFLSKISHIAKTCDVYIQIDNYNVVDKYEKMIEGSMFIMTMNNRQSILNFITREVFGYRWYS